MISIRGNVLTDEDFKSLMDNVLDYVSESVAKTFGPYGHNALIHSGDTVYSTKDGFHTLNAIKMGNSVADSIKYLIGSVAQSIVLSVGDGSTTSIIAANKLNRRMRELTEKYRIRELEDGLVSCIDTIIAELYANSHVIDYNDNDDLYKSIKKIAMVSTNWNEDLSDMIAKSYVETRNPIIKIEDSGTPNTFLEFIEGYELAGTFLLPEQYATDRDNNRAILQNPLILSFDHTVQGRYILSLTYVAQICSLMKRPLVLLAPGFDTMFLNKLSVANAQNFKNRQPAINIFLGKVYNTYEIDRACIRDFANLTGTISISADNDDFKEFLDDVATTMSKVTEGLAENEKNAINSEKSTMMTSAIAYLTETCGTCEEIILSEKSILVKGLPQIDADIIKDTKDSIKAEIDRKIKDADAKSILTDDIRMKRIRLGKLACKMGIIKVGGYGAANLQAKKDALDDATRACEAAYRDGYNMGGCLSIIRAIHNWKNAQVEGVPSVQVDIMNAIEDAFSLVFSQLFINKYDTCIDDILVKVGKETLTIDGIITKCCEDGCAFDIITETFDVEGKVVNPVNVDIEALKACMRLVLTSVTSNQLIFNNYELLAGSADLQGIELKEVK